MTKTTIAKYLCILGASMALSGCSGIFSGVYDEPPTEESMTRTQAGQLYIDASDWTKWHYIDLAEVSTRTLEDSMFNPSSVWVSYDVPLDPQEGESASKAGIYNYWYDVFGAGISKNEFRNYTPTPVQPEPERWSLAIHRNNVRTNGGEAAETDFSDIEEIPLTKEYLESLAFSADKWNETDVWVNQDQMLSGLIGNQGIEVNPTLSSWLGIELPPIPPAFTLNRHVFILRLSDGSFAAIQLANYLGPTGTKCCLTINYKYPVVFK